jgi:AraC-like DNA-binding protein
MNRDTNSNMFNVLIDPSSERKIIDLRKLRFRDIFVLGRYNYAYAHAPLEKHSHGNMIEICLQDEGTQPYHIADREYLLKGGDVLLTLPHERHGSAPTPLNRGRLYWMLLRIPAARDRFLDLPCAEGRALIQELCAVKSRQFRGRRMLKYYLERIFEVHDAGTTPWRSAEIRNWALRFLLDVLADARQFANTRISYQICQAMEHIHQRTYEDFVPLETLAAIAHLSLPRFKTRFKQETGCAPHNYMMLKKMEAARRELSRSDKSITAIGMELGFASGQYFATVFKRYLRQTPQQFRQAHSTCDRPRTGEPGL